MKNRLILPAALLSALIFSGAAAPSAEAALSCAALTSSGLIGGGGLGAQIGSRMGIAARGTAIPGTWPVGVIGAVTFGAGALIACTMPYWGPPAAVSILELLTAIGVTALVTAIVATLVDLPETARGAWRAARRRFIELTREPVMAYGAGRVYDLADWPWPTSRLTATAATLYPPPYSDPDAILSFIRERLGRFD